MKLINKFTIWYLCIALTCTIVGTAITFYSIKAKMDDAAIDRLITINGLAAERIKTGKLYDSSILGRKVIVHQLENALPSVANQIAKSESTYPGSQKKEYRITVESFYKINKRNYSITSFGYVIQSENLLAGLESTILWKWLLILSLIAVSARLVSRIILSPLKQTLKVLEDFNLRKKAKIDLPLTTTKEFNELNVFVKNMTDKAVEEYISLKEFTENASHELQTPVAVMGMKLELLAESAITDEQALLIRDIQDSVEKLSRINSSLVLLTRLENHEYAATGPIRFCRLISQTLDSYAELMQMKSLTLTRNVMSRVFVQMHPMLCQLLLNNLISNAIRHNVEGGTIHVELLTDTLTIRNSGPEPSVPTNELFQRFKKGNQSSKSIGIGLSIVKQICEMRGLTVSYDFIKGYHVIIVRFTGIPGEELNVSEPEQDPAFHEIIQPAF